MKPISLRPHHIEAFKERKLYDSTAIEAANGVMNKLYGNEFTDRYVNFMNSMDENSLVKVIDSNDDICDGLMCPFSDLCRAKKYDEVTDAMLENYGMPITSDIFTEAHEKTPAYHDTQSLRRLGINVGETYRIGDITSG